ncbi:MAG: NAD(P)H-hydrate dehydratase [Clostridia bacterium]|nr:NAD(P)H-hydrate dehydratase [Clostridia bacterium]
MRVYSCEQMRNIEEIANRRGMSYITMMENAGVACFKEICNIIGDSCPESVTVLCGSGKNGGDGFVIARHLSEAGYKVNVLLTCGLPKAEEAVAMYSKLSTDNIIITNSSDAITNSLEIINKSDILIDCLFGIGFKGELRGDSLTIVKEVNKNKKAVKISVDIPSGLEGDSNAVNGEFIKADFTLAITCKKPVHALKPTADYCGEVRVLDIGFSEDCYNSVECEFYSADTNFIKSNLPVRKLDSNKGTYGKLLSVCGSMRMQGAAVLCANAAVKSGVGLLTCAFPQKAYCAIASKLTEPLMLPLPDDENGFLSSEAISEIGEKLLTSTAVVIGCGLGVTDGTGQVLEYVLKNAKCPVLIDADGLNILSENINILKTVEAPVVLTPHPGEMAKLLKKSIAEIQQNRISSCKELSELTGAVVLLKGVNTVISAGDEVYINPTGNQGMAKGGSGDVLSGIIGSLLAQGVKPLESAVCAAYIHGLCGDILADEYSLTGLTPSMIVDYLPKLFSKFENKAD